ncbi:MAG: DUF1653 domain-containing protein [Candidatus Taylorbacteria bacterium]
MKIPSKIPENGFYYHYKHDPNSTVNNYAYEFIGVGCHTEEDCRKEDSNMAVYRPLYESSAYNAGKFFDLRPLSMWMGDVTKDGKTFPRFSKITEINTITELTKVKDMMYP